MLQLAEVSKIYKTAGFEQVALDEASIAFRDSEFVAVLGPSGSGKTTLLNIVGGLDHYNAGDLIIDGISTRNYKDRDWDTYRNNRIGFVFQSYNLIPHQSVLVNVELALTLAGISKTERRERAKAALEEVGLSEHINKKPNQLSGGQMQRVAIARALINDPEIVLADEPTGALDSKTSLQIMALLTEIAKNRLVIMVTHNPELAERYANRIVKLHDGHVAADSNPFIPTVDDVTGKERVIRRTAMSFFTAVSLSFTNLMSKKGRTIMTAFAGSIGIIGIAAILSLANGVNSNIKETEEGTLVAYPLSIQSSSIDIMSMFSFSVSAGDGGTAQAGEEGGEAASEDVIIKERKQVVNTLGSIGQNDLVALKAYFDENGGEINQYVNAIEYSYDLTPQIFASDTANGPVQVNPDAFTRSMGLGQGGGFEQLMTLGSSATYFNPLLENVDLLKEQYDVVAGRWPEAYSECVLVLNGDNSISDHLLYLMGLRDPAELEAMVDQFRNEEEVTTPEDTLEFNANEILGVTFKLVPATSFYAYDEEHSVWTDKKSDEEYLKGLIEAGETLSVVGILRGNPDAEATSLSEGLYYPASLTYHIADQAAQTQIVKDQLANREINVFSGKSFEEENEENSSGGFALDDILSIDEDAIAKAFGINPSAFNLDLSKVLDPAALSAQMPAPPEVDLEDFVASAGTSVSSEDVAKISDVVMRNYLDYCSKENISDPAEIASGLSDYLAKPEVQEELAKAIGDTVDTEEMQADLQQALTLYMQERLAGYTAALMTLMQQQLETGLMSAMQQLNTNMASAMSFNQDAFMGAFQFDMDATEVSELMTALMAQESGTCDSNLKKLGYADRAKPAGIDIYPIDFESKQSVIDILDSYNEQKREAGAEDQVIAYNDIVGALMSFVTDIVDMISSVLVAFVAISLMVSSIMIGVITYISVLERKKEIGILRAIGARKRDIGNVFNAETLIVGLIAGIMGILITLLLMTIANLIVSTTMGIQSIAILPVNAAVVLVLVSMGLTFIAGLIPSSAASRRDPVEALRSE
jgi:ABC-type lipoprotein export system ATPase subunit